MSKQNKENKGLVGGTLYVTNLDENNDPVGKPRALGVLGMKEDETMSILSKGIEGITGFTTTGLTTSAEIVECNYFNINDVDEKVWRHIIENELVSYHRTMGTVEEGDEIFELFYFDFNSYKRKVRIKHDNIEDVHGHCFEQLKKGAIALYTNEEYGSYKDVKSTIKAINEWISDSFK